MQSSLAGVKREPVRERRPPPSQHWLSCCGSTRKSPEDAGAMAQAPQIGCHIIFDIYSFPLMGMEIRTVIFESFQDN